MYFTNMYPWNWAEGLQRVTFSPRSSSASSQEADSIEGEPSTVIKTDHNKRGRPRAEKISSLILQGAVSANNIRCKVCSRVFPREKSLQAHMRTHTGERPYICDYPGCGKSFCQSGQLKTHQRLHTGEKPFACSIEGCPSRFTHANRHCSEHPYASLRRLPTHGKDKLTVLTSSTTNQSVTEWIARESHMREEISIAPMQPEKKFKRENSIVPPATPVVHVHQIEVAPKTVTVTPPITLVTPVSSPTTPVVVPSPPAMPSSKPVATKSMLGHRPFKKEATDKWVSALALLELAQGVS